MRVPGHLYEASPPAIEVASAFELRGRKVLVAWSVAAAQREAWRAAEKHFFASVGCA
jgi:hypothetical protein